jgi:hypothetical protein
MRTLCISDLHLGGSSGVDVLRHEAPRERLAQALDGVDRLVLLGDTLELRHGPAGDALAAARPAMEQIAEALPADAEIVVVPGNHDHALLSHWLDHRTKPLGLETRVRPGNASPLARTLGGWLGVKRTSLAYPGLWLRDDVYAIHGHYGDVHGTVPTFERLAAGVMRRLSGGLPEGRLTAEDYERVVAPMYAWTHSAAQRVRAGEPAAGAGRAAQAYEMLAGDGHQPVRARVLSAVFPLGVMGLNRIGIGPLSTDLSGPALRRNGIVATRESLVRLGGEAPHVVFGHPHRAGPLPDDDAPEWGGLVNCGNWVYETTFLAGPGGDSPYWPGGAVEVTGDGPPRILRLLGDLKAQDLA